MQTNYRPVPNNENTKAKQQNYHLLESNTPIQAQQPSPRPPPPPPPPPPLSPPSNPQQPIQTWQPQQLQQKIVYINNVPSLAAMQPQPQPQPPPPPQPPAHQAPADSRCNGKQNAIYREEYDCSAFYICEISTAGQTRIHTFKCPHGLVFNMDECTCDWPLPTRQCVIPLTNNFCKLTGPDESKRSSSSYMVYQRVEPPLPPMPTWPSAFTCENREKGLYRDPYDCSKFYYCQILTTAGLTIKHDFSCPNGLHFNLYNCQCDWPFNSNCNLNGVSMLCSGF